MADFDWPQDLVPYAQTFYLQPHTGGSESPFSRTTKVYGLSAPRWICAMSFRGGFRGDGLDQPQTAFGPRLDGLVAKLKGRQSRVAIFDFRRNRQRSALWPAAAGNLAAIAGDTQLTITNLLPGTKIHAGDYFGGDGRPHIVIDDPFVVADDTGNATVNFEPPLKAAIAANAATFEKVTALFRLTSDDAGSNPVTVGELQQMTLEFAEAL